MSIDGDYYLSSREIRSVWRDEEEDFIKETIEYSKRKMSLLDYLSSVAHSGHEIAVLTPSFQTEGHLVQIGSDFFSIVSSETPRFAQSFIVGNEENPRIDGIEINIKPQSTTSNNYRFIKHEKTFRSLLDDIANRNCYVEIETRHENMYQGTYELYSNFISFTPDNKESQKTLVASGTVIIPIDGIVSILYEI